MKNIKNSGANETGHCHTDTFSCFIIGESTLPIKCAEILLRHGHEIYGIISNDPNVTKWSEEKDIPCIKVRKSKVFSFLNSQSFDYLLSINGDYVIPEELLALPNKLTINYHDSPLPKYAGMYATSWALMNRESMHAVSWHVADRGIDTGDILKQCPVPIEPKDTAFTLNLRCYETALKTFEELMSEIASGQVKRQTQDLNERTYFGYYKRPTSACIFSFNDDAYKIDAFLRALDFGSYENPLGMPKIGVEKDFFVIPGILVADSASGLPAGTVTSIDDESVTVSTLTKDIEIREIYSIDGKMIPINDFTARWNIYEGYNFADIDRESANQIDAYNTIVCRYEKSWVKRLTRLQPLEIPAVSGKPLNAGSRKKNKKKFSMPAIDHFRGVMSPPEFLITVFSIYLFKFTNLSSFDIGYSHSSLSQDIKGLEGIFAQQVPLHIHMNAEQTFREMAAAVQEQLNRIRKRKTYVKDIIMRYPGLKSSPAKLEKTLALGVTVVDAAPLDLFDFSVNGTVNIIIPAHGNECLCFCDTPVMEADGTIISIKEIAARVVENEDIQLMDIRIMNDLIYSQSDISREDLEDFGF